MRGGKEGGGKRGERGGGEQGRKGRESKKLLLAVPSTSKASRWAPVKGNTEKGGPLQVGSMSWQPGGPLQVGRGHFRCVGVTVMMH